jgi:hypothetical protein
LPSGDAAPSSGWLGYLRRRAPVAQLRFHLGDLGVGEPACWLSPGLPVDCAAAVRRSMRLFVDEVMPAVTGALVPV